MHPMSKKLINTLKGNNPPSTPPFWLMRQAGRYLPEYREIREQAGSFLDLCYNPSFATEVTMQPIRRYGMDAAILFSDILVTPHALGQDVRFVQGEGPKLEALRGAHDIEKLSMNKFHDVLAPVYETVSCIRKQLDEEGFTETALIGFAGAPWTVACYMIEGGGSKEFAHIKRWAYQDPESFQALMDLLSGASASYIIKQIEAGAEVIQIFDSWAGVLPQKEFEKWVIRPTISIVNTVRAAYPDIPIIGFPRGAGILYEDYARQTAIDGLSLDYSVPLRQAQELQKILPAQGNLDPMALLAGGEALVNGVRDVLEALAKDGNFIFNLGHGIHKDTPPEHVELLAELIKGSSV